MTTDTESEIMVTRETINTSTVMSDSLIEEPAQEEVFISAIDDTEGSGIDVNKQKNYRIWRKNSKVLYDYLNTNSLKWPSLSIDVLPYHSTVKNDRFYLLTSFTSDQLPEDEKVIMTNMSTLNIPQSDLNCFEMENMEFQVLKGNENKPKREQQASLKNLNTSFTAQDEPIREYKAHNLKNEIEITYPENEQCNRISVNLNNPDIFATASTKFGNIYIYDKTKCITTNSSVKNLMPTNYALNLNGFNDDENVEVSCIQWNNMKTAELASGLTNGLLQVWDLQSIYKSDKSTYNQPTSFTVVDESGINDISYMPDHHSIIATGCESEYLQLFDTRSQNIVLKTANSEGHNSINSLQFNSHNSNLIVTGGSDSSGQITVHDIRRLAAPVLNFTHSMGNSNAFISDNNSISKVQWNPFLPGVLLSAGMDDGLIKLWDTTATNGKLEDEKSYHASLIFTHGGHMLGVTDCCWDLFDPWSVSSCSFDNSLHIWKPSKRAIDEYFI